ncbi:MAG: T9SS type A sorting domain-containing protein, partial [Lutibacter sp.]
VGSNSTYTIAQTDVEATSAGSTAAQQQFMVTSLPQKGTVKKQNVALNLGDTFTQNDINSNKIAYTNTSSVSASDSFKVDITNATGGFLADQQISFNIDSALAVDDAFFEKTGISVYPTVSNGSFYIQSNLYLGKTLVEVYNINGQQLFKKEIQFNSFEIKPIITGKKSSGIYILKLTSDKGSGSKKLIFE